MIVVRVIGDGPRDEHIIGPLVSNHCPKGLSIASPFTYDHWHELPSVRRHRAVLDPMVFSEARKLERVLLDENSDPKHDIVVAVVDLDKHPRHSKRKSVEHILHMYPEAKVAFGEANRNVESWLIDDCKAVRTGLKLSSSYKVPTWRDGVDHKPEVNDLIDSSGIDRNEGLKAIASEVRRTRCPNAHQTGFEDFCNDVDRVFGAMAAAPSVSGAIRPSPNSAN